MPESKSRKKPAKPTPPKAEAAAPDTGNPRWLVPVMLGLMLVGLVWIITYYIGSGKIPIPGIHAWNLLIGFALLLTGFGLTTRWK